MLRLIEYPGKLAFEQSGNYFTAPFGFSVVNASQNAIFNIFSLNERLFNIEVVFTDIKDQAGQSFLNVKAVIDLLVQYSGSGTSSGSSSGGVQEITGNVTISDITSPLLIDNFPSSYAVTGEVEVKNDAGQPLNVAFPTTPTVNVGNEIEVKNDAGQPLNVSLPASLKQRTDYQRYKNLNLGNVPSPVKTTLGNIYGMHVFNNNGVPVFLKFFNTNVAPNIATAAPDLVLRINANDRIDWVCDTFPKTFEFSSGIFVACVTGSADFNNTAPAIPICLNLFFA